MFNYSNEPRAVTFAESLYHGKYTDYFSRESIELAGSTALGLQPWDYRIFVK